MGARGPMPTPRDGGFTLLEIMIVVSIVSVLAAIAVPRMLEAQRQAQKTKAIAQLRQIYDAQQRYREKNGTYAANLAALVSARLLPSPFVSTNLGVQRVGYYDFQTGIPSAITGDPPPPSAQVNATLRFRVGCAPSGTTSADRLLRGDKMLFMLETGQIYEHRAPSCLLNHVSSTVGSEYDTQFGTYYPPLVVE